MIRDILGVGLGAKPILNTDVFAFAPADISPRKIPKGVTPPRRIIHGRGRRRARLMAIAMGIPTTNGAVYYDDDRFVANPLVFCGTVGVIRSATAWTSRSNRAISVVSLGGRTGRDGVHGATFSPPRSKKASLPASCRSASRHLMGKARHG